MEEVRPEVERLAWATPPVWIQDKDVLYPDRPSSFISELVVLRQRGSFLWVLSLSVQRKCLAIATQWRAKQINTERKNIERTS